MIDVQNSPAFRKIRIKKVGVQKLSYPIIFCDSDNAEINSIGNFALYSSLDPDQKGTHMSRFIHTLYEYMPKISSEKIGKIAKDITKKLNSDFAQVKCDFEYFYEVFSPITKSPGLSNAYVSLNSEYIEPKKLSQFSYTVKVPVKSLCPCSKSISKYGAHSQRSYISLQISDPKISIRKCIELAETSASSALYPILKREDERFVTEKAYENPRFVEDLVREVATKLLELKQSYESFEVSAVNYESIHHHDVFATISSEDI